MAPLTLRRLSPESWGDRLGRAIKECGLTMREIQEVLFPHVSKSGVARLVKRQEAPTYRKERARAALIVYLCGYELEEFDLSPADMPPAIDLRALERIRRAMPSTKWKTARPQMAAAA
ncbi:MAG TPA: hypothetical protein VLL25_16890 [Acidimicrobiales bacterium]|nr:hypothetical protein [Acidimicrobiales bacterium]